MDAQNNVEVIGPANFTPDADFDELHDKDDTTDIIGFIDEVHLPCVVGKKEKYDLFKFVVNNGGSKRIVCLVWGKALIQKYVEDVQVGKIISIEGATTKAVCLTYYKEAANFVPFELLIKQDVTTIQFSGLHDMNMNPEVNMANVQEVDFKTVGKAHGFVTLQGNIKMKFVRALNKRTNEYYGCGTITDGSAKVKISIANYTGLVIEKGIMVKVIGQIDEDAAMTTIICRDDASVVPVPGGATMTPEELARGVKSPKRGIE